MKKTVFYHAGCPVCISAETEMINLIGAEKLAIIDLGNDKSRLQEAKDAGVQSVPALVTAGGQVLHINFGASIDAL